MSSQRHRLGSCCVICWFLIASFIAAIYVFNSSFSRFGGNRNIPKDHLQFLNNASEAAVREEEKIILFWTSFFESEDFYFGTGRSPFQRTNCTVQKCWTTTDKTMLDKSHAVVFHARDIKLDNLPTSRNLDQRWVFFLLESPENTPINSLYSMSNFNWTMTYRRDSDIYLPYGRFTEKLSSDADLDKVLDRKMKKVAWFVSHCQTASKREDYADELSQYIPVDIYGSCGQLQCKERKPCNEMLRDSYKFYLAFENSLCRDYVTEKFFTALEYYVVPVVYGSADYHAVAPPHSYIDTRDFPSPKELAKYLNYLSHNQSAYREYFRWRRKYKIVDSSQSWCDLCEKLHDFTMPSKTYEDMYQWWIAESHCVRNI